jgi:acetyl-CoA carboxylase biotin carboxylase subunit
MTLGRILIANRGEIAVRIARAARTLGVETVLAASSADKNSLAAQEADRTVVVGPGPARSSYLAAPVILHAAQATGCDALHPGFGFLSERADFAQLCEDEGIVFVGPTAECIRRVGDKLSARALARAAGVPMAAGSDEVGSVSAAHAVADAIGYPVITKASAGGGGRGMVVAQNRTELTAGFERASLEATEAFGDGRLYLERYVERARHVEVQVMGDGGGGMLHFGERDCSVQRRHQKMVEEAPATVLSPATRERLHRAAVDLLAPIGYRGAGTVEFLYDEVTDSFFFMEVNARLQVEHPVSEQICGVDLVALQLEIAGGAPLPFAQSDVVPRGHAIEVRILAEDPAQGFRPSPGLVIGWQPPSGAGVRLDTSVGEGSVVSPYYDSMIAKLIVTGSDRADSLRVLRAALDDFHVKGISTNIPLLRRLTADQDFTANRTSTRWLDEAVARFVETRGPR